MFWIFSVREVAWEIQIANRIVAYGTVGKHVTKWKSERKPFIKIDVNIR